MRKTPYRPGRNNKPGHPVYSDPRYRAARTQLKKTDWVCHACGYDIDMQLSYPHPLSWSADHIIPKSKLTADDNRLWHISNLQAMHLVHNQARGDKQPPALPPTPLQW